MASVREQILAALLARLETVPNATAKREALLPETVPAGGLIILRDGDPGDPEVIITRWAPGCENDTGSYITHVAARLGVAPDQAIDQTNPTMVGLVEGIIRHENGQQPYAREVILAGVGMGLGSV